MNRKTLLIIIVVLLIGGVYFITKDKTMQKDHNGMNMSKEQTTSGTYKLQLLSSTNNLKPNEETTIKYKIVDDKSDVLKKFEFDHTKLMHFIVIRKDLQDFQHLHPDFNQNTGVFTIPVTFSDAGKYRLFADFTPAGSSMGSDGMMQSTTPYQEVNVGDLAQYTPQDVTPDTDTTKTVDGYQIDYSVPQNIQAGKEVKIMLHVTQDGNPVTNMEEYLGAQAHGIILKKDTLDFAHIHAMGSSMNHMMNGQAMHMEMTNKGPDINFSYSFPSKGTYKLFTQFQLDGKVITTDYTFQIN